MVAGVAGAPHPLHPARRAYHRIVGHGVVRRVVKVVRPLVDRLRTRLDRLGPRSLLLHVRHAVGAKHPHDVVHRYVAQILRHEQVDEIVDVGEPSAGEPIGRHSSVKPQGSDVLTGQLDVGGVGIQSLDEVATTGTKSGRELPIAAAEVHDQPTLDPGSREDLPSRLPGLARSERARSSKTDGCPENP